MIGKFEETDRATFAAMADILIPASDGMPSAAQIGVQGHALDHVLGLRPELADDLLRGLRASIGCDPAAAVEKLNSEDPTALEAIGLVASAVYYMDRRVRDVLGYPGQESRPHRPHEEDDYLRDDLLKPVIDRGPIHRPVPK